MADSIFALKITDYNFLVAWVGAIAYTLQIYYDFSGYSDMAIGMAKIFGFEFNENFNHPYSDMICPLSSRQVKYLKISTDYTYILIEM